MSALRELIASFGIEVDDGPLKEFDGKIEAVTSHLETMGAFLGGSFLGGAFVGFMESNASAVASLDDMSQRLGVSADDLQSFGYAAEMSGISMDSAGASIGKLTRLLGEAGTGNATAAKAFSDLKIQVKDASGVIRPSGDIIAEVADRIADMKTPAEQTAAAVSVFGKSGAELLPLLQQGSDGIQELNAEFDELGILLDETAIKSLADLDDQFARTNLASARLKQQVAAELTPVFMPLLKAFTTATATMKDLVATTNIVKDTMAVFAIGGLWKSMPYVTKFAEAVNGKLGKSLELFQGIATNTANVWKFNMTDAGKLLAGSTLERFGVLGKKASETAKGFKPLWDAIKMPLGVSAAIGALVLLALAMEDIYTWATGGESVIGEWMDNLLGKGESDKLAKELSASFAEMGKAMKDILPDLTNLAKQMLELVAAAGPSMAAGFIEAVKWTSQLVKDLTEAAKLWAEFQKGDNRSVDANIDAAKTGVTNFTGQSSLIDTIGNLVGQAGAKLTDVIGINDAASLSEFDSGAFLKEGPATGLAGGVTQSNAINITFNGTVDPAAAQTVVKGVGGEMAKQRDALAAVTSTGR